MARSADIEARLAELAALREDADSEAARAVLAKALASKTGLLVAKAAGIAGQCGVAALAPALLAAFGRLCTASHKNDPGCVAKTAVVEALRRLSGELPARELADRVLLPGARHVQEEPVWGGRSDTAANLRAACAIGLVEAKHPTALEVLADQLADPLPEVRAASARALAWRGGSDAVPLLRLRLGVTELEATVWGEYLRALISLAGTSAVPHVAGLLDTDDEERFGEAALALGESRSHEAFALLQAAWARTFDDARRSVMAAAFAALRREEAFDFLVARVTEDAPKTACTAIRALAFRRADPALRARLAEVVDACGDATVVRCFREAFGAGDG